MAIRFLFRLLSPLLLLLPAASAAWADSPPPPASPALHITAEHAPPASMRDGDTLVGRETDKVREMLTRAAVPHRIDLLPWKRAYTLALQNPNTCVYSTSRTPEREALFKWVGPTDEAEWVLLGRADHKFPLRTLEDARPLRIGTYHGDARDEFLRARGFNVEPVQNDASNPKKLMLNRIDLWAVGMRAGTLPPSMLELDKAIVPLLTFHRVKVYLACHRSVPDALVDKLNAALDTMRRDGSFIRLDRKYEQWSKPE